MKELVINSTTQHTLLLFVPLAIAYLLRIGKLRGSSILGGLIGGILLGPMIFGSLAPSYWEGIFQGGKQAHQQVLQLEQQQKSAMNQAIEVGGSEPLILQLRADQQYELDQKITLWKNQQWKDQRTLRNYALLLIFVVLFSGAMRSKSTGKSDFGTSLSVGVWAAILPGGVIAVLSHYWWDTSITQSIGMGACLAVGPWTLTRWEQQAADNAEVGGAALMLRCGFVAWIVASAAALYCGWMVQGVMALVWLSPLLLLPVYWNVPKKHIPWLEWFADRAAIPSIIASAMVLIHPLEALKFWPILLILLISADGRWLGGFTGLRILGGRTTVDAMRTTMPLVDASVSQLCLGVMLFGIGVLSQELTMSIIIGALFIELTAPTRKKFALELQEASFNCD
ncbi:MAG: hypothetical protein QGI78_00465 [Phycisphaerales bacterium]|nr:hypothetical protein [Phycisphaerales bacterium]